MNEKVQMAVIVALSLVGLAAIHVAHTAIVTRYDGSFDVEVGTSGGRIKVMGRSDPDHSLPPAD